MASNPSPAKADGDGLDLDTNTLPIHPLSLGEDNPAADGSAEEDVGEKVIESDGEKVGADGLGEEADVQVVLDGGYTEKNDYVVEEAPVFGLALDVSGVEKEEEKVGVDGDSVQEGDSIVEGESVKAGDADASLGSISPEVQGKDNFESDQSQKPFENQERTVRADDVVKRGRGRTRKNPDGSQQKNLQSKHNSPVGCPIKTGKKRGRPSKNHDSKDDCEKNAPSTQKNSSINSEKRPRGRPRKFLKSEYDDMGRSKLDKKADPKTGEQFAAHNMTLTVGDYASLDANKMLSQLRLLSIGRNEEHSYLLVGIEFFTQVRAFLWKHEKSKERKNRKKKLVNFEPEVSKPHHVPDSCLFDVGLESSPETESIASRTRKHKGASQKSEENKKAKRAPGNERQKVEGNRIMSSSSVKIKEESPTAMILTFSDSGAIPTAADLIELFSTFGPIIEEETEILIKEDRARVVFKYHDHAEKAYNSAGKYRVFGAASVSYRLSYSFSPKSSLAAFPEEKNNDTHQGKESNYTATQNM